MAMDKSWREINRKLDLLLKHAGIEDTGEPEQPAPRGQARKLTAQEQDAINNAPKAEATIPDAQRGPRVTQQNAPDTSGSTPPTPRVPSDAVGSVTVETQEADGDVSVDTMSADKAKGKK